MSENESLKAFEEDVSEDEELLFNSDSSDISEEREGQLAIDVYQNEDEIVVESPIAAVHSDDLEINITTESVSIKGRRERNSKVEDKDYFYQECYWGRFSRSIILPQEIDPEKAEASIKNGVLVIKMPKLRKQKQRRLKVKID
ncbi:MAG: Hsp20/alpha crystallin family protein [bacterium]|nr:Hsp20/alpha crystallin family protein [bacterium]